MWGRIWALAVLAAGIWLLSVHGQSRPLPSGLDAGPRQFSAARAEAVLNRVLGEQHPHPAGSAENAAVRARILQELSTMGVQARTQTGLHCYGRERWNLLPCATVTNIIAGVAPGAGKQVVLMAHYDSVAAGPGAGDDGAGVAILLESIRALKARGIEGGAEHPVIALFTDGEENGLLGASMFLREPLQRAKAGAVVNVEARGNQGPSYLFQTGAGNLPLIDLYRRNLSHYAASSLYGEIYKYLPNDTDMTPFLEAGVTGYNFAFIGNVAGYHTPLDRREHLDHSSLQQEGNAALAMSEALAHADHTTLGGRDAVYLDVLGRWLPRLPVNWVLPLAIAAFLVIALAGLLTPRGRRELPQPIVAGLMPVLLLAGCVGMGFVLHGLAAWISGEPDPSFATPIWLRGSLAFGVLAVALLASRWADAIACWLWFAVLAIACAIWAPGLSPYFLFPSLVAAPLLLVTARGGRGVAVFLAALVALVIWLGLNAGSEPIMGLKVHALFTLSAGFGLLSLLPLLRTAKTWGWSFTAALLLALVLAVTAGLRPAFSDHAPMRLNLRYVEQDGQARWIADPVAHLPDSLRAAARFSDAPQRFAGQGGYVAAAGPARFPAPSASVRRTGNEVTLDLNAAGDGVTLLVPREAGLKSFRMADATVAAAGRPVQISCGTPDCGSARIILSFETAAPASLTLIARRRGLPPEGGRLLKARPTWAVPSQAGDVTLLARKIEIPPG
jgi:hypothetical protein